MSLICSSFVDNMKLLFFTYSLLFGLGSSCVFSAGLVVISQYFKKRQSLATGLLTGGHGGGVLIMGPTLEALIRAIGWKDAYRIMAGVAFVLCSLAITFDPNVEKDAEEKDKGERKEIKEGENDSLIRTKMKKIFDFSVWKVPPVIAIVLAACVVEFGHFVPQIHLVSDYSGATGSQFRPHVHTYRDIFLNPQFFLPDSKISTSSRIRPVSGFTLVPGLLWEYWQQSMRHKAREICILPCLSR